MRISQLLRTVLDKWPSRRSKNTALELLHIMGLIKGKSATELEETERQHFGRTFDDLLRSGYSPRLGMKDDDGNLWTASGIVAEERFQFRQTLHAVQAISNIEIVWEGKPKPVTDIGDRISSSRAMTHTPYPSVKTTSVDRTEAVSYLEGLQESLLAQSDPAYHDRPDAASILETGALDDWVRKHFNVEGPENITDTRHRLSSLLRSDAERWTPTTRFEQPQDHFLVLRLIEWVEPAITLLGYTPQSRPVFGTLPTGDVNALTLAVPGTTHHIVAFNAGLFAFCNRMAKIVASTLVPSNVGIPNMEERYVALSADPKQAIGNIEQNPHILASFQDTLLSYLSHGRMGSAPLFLEHPFSQFASWLRDAMEVFIMGHEYGHMISGHTTAALVRAKHFRGENELDEIIRSWEDELEADRIGLQSAVTALIKEGIPLGVIHAGAELFFSLVVLLEKGTFLMRSGTIRPEPAFTFTQRDRELHISVTEGFSGSHPPGELRREALRATMKMSLSANLLEQAMSMADLATEIVDQLWVRTVPVVQSHRVNASLADMWR